MIAPLALLAAPAAALAAASGGRVLAPNCNAVQYKPARVVLACGDGSNYLAKLHWSGWTATKATASGVDEVNDCKPDCVAGHFHEYPVTVTLLRPMSCKKQKHKVFGHIELTFGSVHPGSKRTTAGPLFCPGP